MAQSFIYFSVRCQLESILKEIESIECAEFPYSHSKDGLLKLKKIYNGHLSNLYSLTDSNSPEAVESVCVSAMKGISSTIDLLGFILRSTNTRNAFEVYAPLLRLSKNIVNIDTKLIVSSEWSYSPFTYISYETLSGFVLIGLPATESSNPFLIPLAGHEIGHTIWAEKNLKKIFDDLLTKSIVCEIGKNWKEYAAIFPGERESDLGMELFPAKWKEAHIWSMRQVEEVFCDMIGLRLFGFAYLYAFAYLLGPLTNTQRSVKYPAIRDRALILIEAANKWGIRIPEDYIDFFPEKNKTNGLGRKGDSDGDEEMDRRVAYLLRLADSARRSIVREIFAPAESVVSDDFVVDVDGSSVIDVMKCFQIMVPPLKCEGISIILNAAWRGLLEKDFFKNKNYNSNKKEYLSELILKSMEILEIEERLKL